MTTVRGTNLVVGFLALVTILILAVVAGFVLEKDNPLSRRFHILARFDNVAGLKVGDPVTLSGAGVGNVKEIRTSPPSGRWPRPGYLIVLDIDDRPEVRDWIREDSVFQIVNDNLFGNRRVDITFGTEGAVLHHDAEVDGVVVSGIGELGRAVENIAVVSEELRFFVEGDGEARPPVAESLADLQETLQNTAVVSAELREALKGEQAADLERTLNDLQLAAENLKKITESTRSAVESMEKAINTLAFWRRWTDDDEQPEERETGSEEEPDERDGTDGGPDARLPGGVPEAPRGRGDPAGPA